MTDLIFPSKDRHRAGSVQFKAWLPRCMREEFAAVCKSQGLTASAVLRVLLLAYIENAAERNHD